MLWTVVAELVRWNPDDVDTRPGEFTGREFLSDLQHLIQAVQSMRYARDGAYPEPTERDVRNVLVLNTADRRTNVRICSPRGWTTCVIPSNGRDIALNGKCPAVSTSRTCRSFDEGDVDVVDVL